MANKSNAKKSSAPASKGRRGRPSARAKKKAEINRAWSILMFALGLGLVAMAIYPGENFWAYLRQNFLFGVFGFSGYFLGILLIYLGVLTAQDKPVKLKMFWACGFIVLLCGFMQVFFAGGAAGSTALRIAAELHRMGKEVWYSGGLAAGIVGIPLQSAFGDAAAKISIAILMVTFFMFLTDTTPYDIYVKVQEKAAREKRRLAKQLEESRAAKARRQREKAARQKAEAEKARHSLSRKPKIDFEIDDRPSKDVFRTQEVQTVVSETFDDVKAQKSLEQQKIDEIMKKLNMSAHAAEEEKTRQPAEAVRPQPEKAPSQTPEQPAEDTEEKNHSEKAYVYKHPPIDLFEKSKNTAWRDVETELKHNARKLVETLESFGVQTRIIDYSPGPSVTRYELQPLAGVKISRITNLADDIALNLAASGVRIEAPIPNKAAVGIEVPNKTSNSVRMRTILESARFRNSQSPLTIALGMDIAGNVVIADLTKMPHLLVAGATGSGKSVCINSVITSFIYKSSPEDVKLILIDPKVVELAEYNGIPHLLMPVVTEPKKAAGALGGAVAEMEKRYLLFAQNSVRDIKSFNRLVRENPDLELEKMPYIAVIIDELADLMMTAGKEVEDYICRLAQKARAAGIHLIVATQRPSVDVITGLIKANIPARIAFAVSSQVDSRTILDGAGAEKLLGMGDMLFLPQGASKPTRVQGTYVTDSEISAVIQYVKKDFVAEYNQEMIENMEKLAAKDKSSADGGMDDKDEMLPKAVEVVVEAGQASTSLLQRRLKLGYARAARIMDEMESMGVIGPYEGSKPRQVLITKNQWLEMTLSQSE